MTPYLKGNVAGECPRCEGAGKVPDKASPHLMKRCPTCRGRRIVGKTKDQVIAETLGREWVSPETNPERQRHV